MARTYPFYLQVLNLKKLFLASSQDAALVECKKWHRWGQQAEFDLKKNNAAKNHELQGGLGAVEWIRKMLGSREDYGGLDQTVRAELSGKAKERVVDPLLALGGERPFRFGKAEHRIVTAGAARGKK